MDFHKITMRGKLLLEKILGIPTWISSDEGRLIYNEINKSLYYADHEKYVQLLTSNITEGTLDVVLDAWNPDEEKKGVRTGNLWGSVNTIGFSPIEDGGIWCSFGLRSNWDLSSDVIFDIEYAVLSADSGDISLNANIWVVGDGETPDYSSPDITAEDEIDPDLVTSKQKETLTNIKIDSSYLDSVDDLIIVNLWRNRYGVSSNHPSWFEMIRFIAYQN